MANILVLADHVGGMIRKTTAELLTIARRLGEPVAVYIGDGVGSALPVLGHYGAAKVIALTNPELSQYLVAPKAEALQQVAQKVAPAAILISSSPEGKEIAARLAVKLESGLITDAVDVQPGDGGPVTTQSVFAGGYTVQATVTKGTPIITVKPNAATPGAGQTAGARPEVEEYDVLISDAAKTARITASRPREATGRPELTEAAIVVSGGRGTGGDFGPIEAFADSLGAAVVRPGPRSTPAGTRTPTRSARPARRSRRSCTSRSASPARSSTGPACRPRRRSWRSTRTPRPRSSSSPTSVWSATCTRYSRPPQTTSKPQGLTPVPCSSRMIGVSHLLPIWSYHFTISM